MKYCKFYNSPLGKIILTSDGKYLTSLSFLEYTSPLQITDYKEKNLHIFTETEKWLDLYFAGKKPLFTPKYKINNLTPFREAVINIMNEIPYGKTITYNDIAKKIAKIKGISKMSAQAVGGAVGWNPICIIIPCHRVVGSNKSLTGYGGGMKNKIGLLKIEGIDLNKFTIPTKGNKI